MTIDSPQMNYFHKLIVWSVSFSFIFVLTGELKAAGAIFVVIACLLPAMWLSLTTNYLSLQIFCAISLLTQLISVPFFYVAPDRYQFNAYRPFNFEVLDALPPLVIVGMFLLTTVYFVKVIQCFVGKPAPWSVTDQFGISIKAPTRQLPFIAGILLLIATSLPIKFWMFANGVGMVGVEPPLLPFRLSGILFYVFNYFVPLVIGYLYIKTRRKSLALALIIAIYAIIMGLTSSSKGVVLLCTAAIIAFAWLDKRYVIFAAATLVSGLGVALSAASRAIVHISDGLTVGAMTDLGVIGTLYETILRVEWGQVVLIFVEISNRIEGFQGLFLASQFNADVVGGARPLFFKSMNMKWAALDHDVMHQEYLGYTIPLGFYNIAASVNAWLLMASNRNLLMILPFALYAGTILAFLETMVRNVGRKYKIPSRLVQAALVISLLWFYIGPGTSEFLFILSCSALLGFLPAIRFGLNRRLTTAGRRGGGSPTKIMDLTQKH
jgi:hypothetical protein